MTKYSRKTEAPMHCCPFSIWARRVVIPLFLLFFSAGANAQVFPLKKFQDKYLLEAHLLYLPEAKTTDTALAQVRQKAFLPLSEFPVPYEPHRPHWLKTTLRNDLPDADEKLEWVIQFSLLPTEIEYFAEGKNGTVQNGKTGFFLPIRERDFKPMLKGNFAKIHLPPHEEVTVFFRMKSERVDMGPEFEMRLMHSASFFDELKSKKQENGIYVGFMLLICIYNLFLYLQVKDRAFIYYSIYLLALITFTVYNTGDLADWLTEPFLKEHPQRINFLKTSVYLIGVTYLTFLRYFLDLKKLLPRWDTIYKYLTWSTAVFFVADVLTMYFTNFNYFYPDIFTIGYGLIFLLVTLASVWPFYHSKEKKARFIVWGMLAMLLGTATVIVNRFSGVEYSTAGFRAGTIIEVIVFSLGLAYRLRETEREKQQAGFALEKSQLMQAQQEREAQRLAELDEAKTEFYTNITHEFRTPLTVISGVAENLKGNEKEKDLILRNSGQLLRQINQLLDLAKVESGQLQLNLAQGNIIQYLGYLTESFYSLAKEKHIRLTFYPETLKLVMGFDEEKLQHIVYNLLSNAIKFTPPGGKVILHVRQVASPSGPFLQLKVSDTGIGIPASDLPKIFQRFYQGGNKNNGPAQSAASTGQTGSGIGLALVKELVGLMGGSIDVESKISKGTEFLVLIPVQMSGNPEVQKIKSLSLKHVHPQSGDRQTGPTKTASPKPFLLLIEDNRDVATYLESILENSYEVRWAKNGQAGIEMALEAVPDIIISDVMMPEKDGYEVCQTLKTDLRTSHVPIILLTAKANESDKLEGLRVGADAYLMKPFNKVELFIRLEKLTELRKVMMERYGKLEANAEEAPPALEDAFLKDLWKAVEGQIDNSDFGVNDLCRTAGMSNTQLNRKLKALTGDTPSRFIRRVRMNVARHLLQTTELNVSEVAYQVGFTDPNYFTRLFSEEFDTPPTSLRK